MQARRYHRDACRNRPTRLPRPLQWSTAAPEDAYGSDRSFSVLETDASDATADPLVQSLGRAGRAEASSERCVHVLDHPLQADFSAPSDEASPRCRQAGLALLTQAGASVPLVGPAESPGPYEARRIVMLVTLGPRGGRRLCLEVTDVCGVVRGVVRGAFNDLSFVLRSKAW